MVRTIGSRELKNRLGTYLRWVRDGATLVVTDRGRPVAELRPLSSETSSLEQRLEALAARGNLTLPTRSELPAFEALDLGGSPLSATLLEDRKDRF